MRLRMTATLVALAIATSGCLSLKAYVDPQLPRVGYADLLARPEPRPVSLRVEFHRNGEPATLGASTARGAVRSVVEKSKLFSTLLDKPADDVDRLEIVLDNVGDTGDAAGKAEESLRAAFNKVVEGLVLNLLLDLQKGEQI